MADYNPFDHDTAQNSYPAAPSPSRRSRHRTLSLISTLSASSSRSYPDLPKTTPSVVLTVRPEQYDAMGSFAPTRSATASLRYLVSSMSRRKQLRSLWLDTMNTPSPSGPPSPVVPAISRTASSSSVMSPPSSPSPRLLPLDVSEYEETPGGMNPILASLERKSKLCTNQVQCATCKKWGRDYPRCGKCNLMWCSRECRLVGGKRHVCRSPAT